MNGNMELTDRIKKCQKDVQAIKASQLLGESNYKVYTYTTSYEATLSGQDTQRTPNCEITFKADDDAFTLGHFTFKFYIDGQLETFTSVSHEFEWMYHGTIYPNAEYAYEISQYAGNINIGKLVLSFAEVSYGAGIDWTGKRVRYETEIKTTRPGKLTGEYHTVYT